MKVYLAGKLLADPLTDYVVKEGSKYAFDAAAKVFMQFIHDLGVWLGTHGLMIGSEFFLIWGMICIMMAITGTGKWLERGAKSLVISVLIGAVRYAV